jgi:proteasome lid subunit RPN8/RPN11
VVGLLATPCDLPRLLTLVFLENLAEEAGRWELRRDHIARVRRELRGRGLRVIGLFHSHPLTEAILGPRDRRNTPTGWLHLVYDVCGLEPKLYVIRRRKGRRRAEQLALSVARSKNSGLLSKRRLTATAPDGGRVTKTASSRRL